MTEFAVLAGLGASLGLWQVARQSKPQHTRLLVECGLLALALSLLGARFFYIGLHSSYYAGHPLEILQIWNGGYAWPGAILGTLLALALVALFQRRSFTWLADGLAPLVAPLGVALWLGCWRVGMAFTAALPEGTWGSLPAPDESGVWAARLPLQPLAALALLAGSFIITSKLPPKAPAGFKAALTGLVLGLDILIPSLFWLDPTPNWGNLRGDSWCALSLAVLSAASIVMVFIKNKKQIQL